MNLRINQFRFLFALATLAILIAAAAPAAYAGEPCCNITGINTKTGVVTARVNATGQVFYFRLNDPAQLKSIHVGQAIYANTAAKQVSLDGQHPAGELVGSEPTANPRGSLGSVLQSRSDFKPYGVIASVQELNAVATKQKGTATQPPSVQFQIPTTQQGQTLPGQPVWMNLNGSQLQFVAFPIHIPNTKTRVGRGPGKGSFWVETTDALVNANGIISGVTKVQSEDYMAGFTGSVAVRLLDSQGNDLAGWQKAGCWGVNLRSGRTETWEIKIDPTVAVKTKTVELKQFDSPCGRDRWEAALAKAEKVAEVGGKLVQVYTSATGGGGMTTSSSSSTQ